MARGGVRGRLAAAVRRRQSRAGISHLSRPIGVVVLVAQVLAALLCLVVLTGWRGPAVTNELTGATYWPWQSLMTMVALGAVAMTLSVGAVRSSLPRRLLLSAGGLVLTLLAVDALPLHSARPWLAAGAVLCTAVALLLPSRPPSFDAIRCGVVLLPFLMGFIATLRSTDVDQALAALRAGQLTPSAAIGLSMLAVFALASAVEEQRERSERLLTWRVTTSAVVVAAVLKLLLLLALYFHLTGGFLGGEASWRPRLDQPLSWAHAAIVAGVIVAIAVLSTRRPVESGGFTPRLAVLALCLGVMQVTALLTLVLVLVVDVVSPSSSTARLFAIPNWAIDHVEMVQLVAVVVLLCSAVVTVAVRRRLTSGTYLWLVGGIWLVPPLIGIAFASDSTLTAWAAPGQVETVVTVAVLAMVLARRPAAPPRALMGLVVVPLVVLHLGSLWPDTWTQGLTQVAVVGAVVIALWLNPPPVYADRRRNERTRGLLLAGNLTILLLYVYLFNDVTLTGGLGSTGTIALLWLGVPITAVLTARVTERDEPALAHPGRPVGGRS